MKPNQRLHFLHRLFSDRENLPYEKLKEEYEKATSASERTLNRDLKILREELGAPLPKSIRKSVGYRKPFSLPGIPDPKALALYGMAAPVLAAMTNAPLPNTAEQIYQYIAQSLPELQEDEDLDRLRSKVFFTSPHVGKINPNIWDPMIEALVNQKELNFRYNRLGTMETTGEKIEPYRLIGHAGNWYLMGNELLKNKGLRIYALSRMTQAYILPKSNSFEIPSDFTLKDHIDPEIGIFLNTAEPQTIRVVFDSRVKDRITERVWHSSQKTDGIPPVGWSGGCVLEFKTNQLEEAFYALLPYLSNGKILEPQPLAQKAQDFAAQMARSLDR